MIYSIDVRVEAPIRETEVSDRVAEAVRTLFPDIELRREPDRFVGESHSLDAFSDVLHEQEILDTARRQFFDGVYERSSSGSQTKSDEADEDGFEFSLKKQPAYKGVVNFAVGSEDELGDIHVRVDVREPDVETFIDYIAPPTEEGRPIEPDER
jgi:predicted RNA binding protein with dsRBD fold (UPF0201 family)